MTNEFTIVVAAATAAVGYDLFQGEKFATATYGRTVDGIAVVGSAAIGDFGFELWAGEARKGAFWNTSAGAAIVPKKEDEKYPKALIPANSQLMAKVIDGATTNPVVIQIKFSSARRRRVGFGTSSTVSTRVWRPTSRYPTRASWQSATGRSY